MTKMLHCPKCGKNYFFSSGLLYCTFCNSILVVKKYENKNGGKRHGK